MEQKEMIVLLSSGNYMTYLDRVEIAVHMKALSERLHQQEAEIEKLVQERGTMKASSPTMEWISVEDERKPNEGEKIIVHSETGAVSIRFYFAEAGFPRFPIVTHWMKYEPPKQKLPTFKDVFLKAFPKAPVEGCGILKVCIEDVFPWAKRKPCDDWTCTECWNQTYFEEEDGE